MGQRSPSMAAKWACVLLLLAAATTMASAQRAKTEAQEPEPKDPREVVKVLAARLESARASVEAAEKRVQSHGLEVAKLEKEKQASADDKDALKRVTVALTAAKKTLKKAKTDVDVQRQKAKVA